VQTHEIAAGQTKLTLAAAGKRIQANGVSRFYILCFGSDLNDNARAVGAKNVRHGNGDGGFTQPVPDIDVIQRSVLKSYNDISWS
jgi:hypothetical protein